MSISERQALTQTSSNAILFLVEDDDIQASIAEAALHRGGYAVRRFARAAGVLEAIKRTPPDAVLLDLGLPDQHGFELCKVLREASEVPIIMVTAQDQPLDRVLGLELGADDYLIKPFLSEELVARVKALLRRAQGKWSARTTLSFDDAALKAHWGNQLLPLTRIEFQLLKRLARRPGHVLSRQQLCEALYDADYDINDRTIDSHIRNLRRKLDPFCKKEQGELIESVYGAGYRFDPG